MAVLVDRTIDAVDGSPVVSAPIRFSPRMGVSQSYGFSYQTTGSPATIGVRAAVEISMDGINWQQILRFPDKSATAGAAHLGKFSAVGDAEGVPAASNLDNASAAAVQAGWYGYYIRGVTKLQTLTGGTAPTVRILVTSLD